VKPTLAFWFDFASTYSYLAAMRIDALASKAGVSVDWRPFLLGPVFKAQGWTTSPFNLYPAKGANMWRDMERSCAEQGLPLVRPDPFPQKSLLAARIATVGRADGWVPAFCRAVFAAEFGAGRQIDDPVLLASLVTDAGGDGASVLEAAATEPAKTALKAATDAAMTLGIFGAPTFVTPDNEVFWGNDRLEQALRWAVSTQPTGIREG
jgi:2-hydroxychromene-2-carboxylate isomerase